VENSRFSEQGLERPVEEPRLISLEVIEEGALRVVGEATVCEARALQLLLLELVEQERESWTLDLSGLSALDSAGAQLLLAFKREAKRVRFHSWPPAMRAFLEQTALFQQLL